MRNFVRILAFVLALLMLSSAFVACGDGNSQGNNNNNNNASTDDPGNTSGKKPLTGMNWEGEEYRILGHYDDDKGFYDFEVYYDEMPTDIVGLAVWNRNNAIKDITRSMY